MKKLSFILLFVALTFVLSACTKTTDSPQVNNPVPGNSVTKNTNTNVITPDLQESPSITLSEVSQHATPTDCWTAIDGNVFNVTEYIKLGIHPGGEKILNACGKEASALFASIDKHSNGKARPTLEKYVIGVLVQ